MGCRCNRIQKHSGRFSSSPMARSSSSIGRDCREVRSRRIRFATSWNLVTASEATPVAVGVLNQIGSPSVTLVPLLSPGNRLHRRDDSTRSERLAGDSYPWTVEQRRTELRFLTEFWAAQEVSLREMEPAGLRERRLG